MKVVDVMTEDVITVAPEASLKEVAELLSRNRISGMPVTDGEAHVLGVVSEADILRLEAGEDRGGPLGWLLSGAPREKIDATTAGEAMASPPITVRPGCDVAEAARLMTERRINRLPVVGADGTLVGIVTRADLVLAFVRSDEEIERELRDDVVVGTLWIDPSDVWVTADAGEVRLAGQVETRADAQLLEYFASRVPGVVSVHSTLRWRKEKYRVQRSDPRVPIARRR